MSYLPKVLKKDKILVQKKDVKRISSLVQELYREMEAQGYDFEGEKTLFIFHHGHSCSIQTNSHIEIDIMKEGVWK